MSGMKNLANAIANDPSFAKQSGMTRAEAAEFVQPGNGNKQSGGVASDAPKCNVNTGPKRIGPDQVN